MMDLDGLRNVTFVDSCSYACYRAGATLSWWKRSHPDDERSTDELLADESFTIPLMNQFTKGLKPFENLHFIRDCPKDEIWRMATLSSYKSNRAAPAASVSRPFGPIIKSFNSHVKDLYPVLRVDNAEADDVIAILTQYMQHVNPACCITIVTVDSDLYQLISTTVQIYNPRTKKYYTDVDAGQEILNTKILKGDASDKVPSQKHDPHDPLYGKIFNNILIDLTYVPRYIQDAVMVNIKPLSAPQIYAPRPIQLGLCCINNHLRETRKIFCSRTARLQTVQDKGTGVLIEKALQNCKDLLHMIHHNTKPTHQNGVPVRVLRVSSDLLPHISNHRLEQPATHDLLIKAVTPILKTIGRTARQYRMRLTFHPGQYNVVATPHEDKFQNTIMELSWHAHVLDLMECDNDSVMVIHGGGIYGDKPKTLQRWITNFSRLPKNVQRRLVLENCEKCFHIEDCLMVSSKTGVPVVFDTHHYECYKLMHPAEDFEDPDFYIPLILDTWQKRHMKPKFHVSEQREGSQTGAHSDYIEVLPQYLLDIPTKYNCNIDIMIEAKAKERAIRQLYDSYPDIDPEHIIKAKPTVRVSRPKIKGKVKVKPEPEPEPEPEQKVKVRRIKIRARII
jgi:UV damage endonuclease UvdE